MPDNLALELKNIRHAFGKTVAVENFNINVRAGEVVCLLGPSGCGKTTALRLASGLEKLQYGEVIVNGYTVADAAENLLPERREIGFVFQDYALFPHFNALKNVEFGLEKLSAGDRQIRAIEVLDQVGMKWAVSRYPHTLSGGQQQRVALARALAPQPPVILFDEPFSGLDARLRDKVRDETLHILKDSGTAALLVTHDAEEAMFMADRIGLMHEGSLVQFGNPENLYFKPKNAFVAEFFGEINRITGVVESGRISTPLGEFIAEGLEEGREVQILIRPELLQLKRNSDVSGLKGRVITSKMLGRTSLIHLSVCKQGRDLHLHSRMPGRFLPEEEAEVYIEFDPIHAFVFPLGLKC